MYDIINLELKLIENCQVFKVLDQIRTVLYISSMYNIFFFCSRLDSFKGRYDNLYDKIIISYYIVEVNRRRRISIESEKSRSR